MNFDAAYLDMIERTISDLYTDRIQRGTHGWIEKLCTDQPSLTEVRDAWQQRKVLIYSPAIDNAALRIEPREKLAALVSIKHAELNEDFTFAGKNEVLRAIISDLLRYYGVTREALRMAKMLDAVLLGPCVYMQHNGYYPIDERACVLERFYGN